MKKALIMLLILTVAVVLEGCDEAPPAEHMVKQEIVVVCGKDNTGTIETIMQDFSNQSTTTRVKLIELSNESDDVYRVLSSTLSGQEIQLDVMLLEDVWVKGFIENGYLLPLGNITDFKSGDYPKGIEKFIGNDTHLYWHPVILDTGVLYYRKDMTDGNATLFEIANGLEGKFTYQCAKGEEMLCCALEFVNLAGDVEEGLKLYKKALANSVDISHDHIVDFKNENVVYTRSWSSDSNNFDAVNSPVRGLVGSKMMQLTDGRGYAITRAYGFAVNKLTQNTAGCMELLEYLKTDDIQMKISKGTKTLPLKKIYFENPMTLDYANYNEAAGEMFDELTFRPSKADYGLLSREAIICLDEYSANKEPIETVSAAIEKLLDN